MSRASPSYLGALAAAGASQHKDDLELGLLSSHACFAQVHALPHTQSSAPVRHGCSTTLQSCFIPAMLAKSRLLGLTLGHSFFMCPVAALLADLYYSIMTCMHGREVAELTAVWGGATAGEQEASKGVTMVARLAAAKP